jgi:hypothetical protein
MQYNPAQLAPCRWEEAQRRKETRLTELEAIEAKRDAAAEADEDNEDENNNINGGGQKRVRKRKKNGPTRRGA